MNEPNPAPINLDELRLLPSWLREDAPPAKSYANYEGGESDSRGDRRGGSGGGRPSRFGDRQSGGNQGRGGPRPQGDRRPGGDRDRGNRSGPPPRGGGGGGGGQRQQRDDRDRRPSAPPAPPVAPAPVKVEFIPDDRIIESIVKQVRTRHLAYPLFGLARMFLQEPARHLVKLALDPAAQTAGAALYQLGEDGPVAMDRQTLERIGYDLYKDKYYVEQTVQKDPPKGNFTSVARDRLSGTLLGPTSYHGYQTVLRGLYESRFSRRMSFEDFRRNIEVVNDAALVERWKEEVRTVVTISTREGEPPVILNTQAEARQHFRQHYFDGLLKTGNSFRLPGSVAKDSAEPALIAAIRQAHEPELRYPAHFVQLLRQALQNDGLHIFKHRKRFVYVSSARPTPFTGGGAVSENVAAILDVVGKNPLITRKALAERILSGRKVEQSPTDSPATQPAAAVAESTEQPVSQEAPVLAEPPLDAIETSAAPAPSAETAEPIRVEAVDEIGEPDKPAIETPEAAAAPIEQPQVESPAAEAESTPATAETTETTDQPPIAAAAEPRSPQDRAKAALASDLRFLVQAGHIIEFHNGTFDLPLPPKPKEEPKAKKMPPPRPNPTAVPPSAANTVETAPSEPLAIVPEAAADVSPESETATEQPEAEAVHESEAFGEEEPLSSTEAQEAEALDPEAAVTASAESPENPAAAADASPTPEGEPPSPGGATPPSAEAVEVKEPY